MAYRQKFDKENFLMGHIIAVFHRSRIVRLAVVLGSLALAGCKSESGGSLVSAGNGKLKILATTGMIGDVAANIVGTHGQVETLMGAGVDPHLYKPTEGDVRKMNEADIIFFNGLHLEAKMADLLEKLESKRRVVAVTSKLPKDILLAPPEFEGNPDPHVWFDVKLWIKAAETIRDTLAEAAPAHAAAFRSNAEKYLKELEDLDAYVRSETAKIPEAQRVMITAHDAFNYFGRAYGVEVRGLQGISTVAEAGARDVDELAAYIAQKKIPAIFVESSVPRRTIEAVQEAVKAKGFDVKIGGEMLSDAMGNEGTPEGTYIGMVRHNVDTLVKALTGSIP
jgi:manganese/zinc/iron transport system substrate-binding protein